MQKLSISVLWLQVKAFAASWHEGHRSDGTRRALMRGRGKSCRWTPELDELLKSAWARGGLRGARRAIRQQQPAWSSYSIKRRAAALGLCRSRAPRWSDGDV